MIFKTEKLSWFLSWIEYEMEGTAIIASEEKLQCLFLFLLGSESDEPASPRSHSVACREAITVSWNFGPLFNDVLNLVYFT